MTEKIMVEINGFRQGMILQSQDPGNPVLLFLHGGPGSPEIAFTQDYPTGLDRLFTVCWWEQRGSGLSYSRRIPKSAMTIEQMMDDAIAVTNYLRNRFGKEKIYLMGHSWGSILGLLTVQKSPELFEAYIGMGQVVRQRESECLGYAYMLEQFRAAGNQKMVRKLERFPLDKGGEISMKYLGLRSVGMGKLGIGIMHHSASFLDSVKIVLRYRGYTVREKFKFALGNSFSLKCFLDFLIHSDFSEKVPSLKVPVYIFQGRYDYQVSYALAREFAKGLQAPVKGFYTFENSAHSPCFEEPEIMCRILSRDVLRGKTELADDLERITSEPPAPSSPHCGTPPVAKAKPPG